MRLLKITLLSLALCGAFFMPAFGAEFHLDWNATFAPPHHEPVVDQVARYRLQAVPQVEWEFFTYELELNAWGVQPWQPSDVVGHFPESWGNSDWSVDKWRFSATHTLKIGPDRLHFFTEYYMPFDRREWGGHGYDNYYLLIGAGGRLW